ncbi:hypothetical protein ANN_25028 [Periplaneta americana]|uniref:Uncharacterized protein n=1 Tax=Periplaneta americana TaxID=6978 RepID=A0ABQ8S073_PERAM|nr:hypothetical protein ANN_25028 [Periplaneta americana]
MASLCEGGNEPAGSLKAICEDVYHMFRDVRTTVAIRGLMQALAASFNSRPSLKRMQSVYVVVMAVNANFTCTPPPSQRITIRDRFIVLRRGLYLASSDVAFSSVLYPSRR